MTAVLVTNCYSVCGGGKWLMLHNLGILEIYFFLNEQGVLCVFLWNSLLLFARGM